MVWTVYRFMFPLGVVIAKVAMFSGISGAALLTPKFLDRVPVALRLGCGVAPLGLAWLLLHDGTNGRRPEERPEPAVVSESDHSHAHCGKGEHRVLGEATGQVMTIAPTGCAPSV
jgi:hypothetical protein